MIFVPKGIILDHLTENHSMDQSEDRSAPLPRGNKHSRKVREEAPSPRLTYYCRVALEMSTRESLNTEPFQVPLTRHGWLPDSLHHGPSLHELQVLKNREWRFQPSSGKQKLKSLIPSVFQMIRSRPQNCLILQLCWCCLECAACCLLRVGVGGKTNLYSTMGTKITFFGSACSVIFCSLSAFAHLDFKIQCSNISWMTMLC